MKRYRYNQKVIHGAAIFETDSEASDSHKLDAKGAIVSTTERVYMTQDSARRICAALQYFSDIDTHTLEKIAKAKYDEWQNEKHLSNVEASYIVMKRMKAMSVEETLQRMAECRGSDTVTAIESLLGFSKDN